MLDYVRVINVRIIITIIIIKVTVSRSLRGPQQVSE